MKLHTKEQRAYNRIRVNLPVIYSYSGEYKVTADKATTSDISDSGMSFYTDKPLRAGLTLDVQIPHIWDVPRICTVRWNSMKSLKCFRVGVFFL
jgi:hypothetical protein